MLDAIYANLTGGSVGGTIIISIALMLFLGFAMTRITKRLKLPNVTAYIVTGILIGPYCLDLIPQSVVEGTDFLADIALAFIAFSVGEFFKLSHLRGNGAKSLVITLCEAFAASLLVFTVTFFVLRLDLIICIVLAALASVTSPTSTIMTIRQTKAKGDFVDTMLQVIALDDAIGLLSFSVALSIASAVVLGGGQVDAGMLVQPVIFNLLAIAIGGAMAVLLKMLLGKRSTDNRLIISVSVLFLFCGICVALDVSPLLGCMVMGMTYVNITDDDKLFKQLNYFSPPFLLLFFVRSGINFNLSALFGGGTLSGSISLVAISVIYLVLRMAGKYGGAFLGAVITKKSTAVRNYLGLGLIPQAGVAIGLSALCARALGPEIGGSMQTVILASSILYELIGPACAKLSLHLSGSYNQQPTEALADEERSNVEILTERLNEIQSQLHDELLTEEERAFNQAADEQIESYYAVTRGKFLNKR